MQIKLLACHAQKVVANQIHWTGTVHIQDMRLFISLLLSICTVSLPFAFAYERETNSINFLELPAGNERKQAFITFLRPIISEKNKSLLQDREKLIQLSKKTKLNIRELRWLKHISQHYSVTFNINDKALWTELLHKIDLIPTSLVIAQAAKESGWGSSRFAQQGNNYFGQWCYTEGCGLVPKSRNHGANHEVAKYDSVKQSVFRYIDNLNSHSAYKNLRDIRSKLRTVDKEITGYHLANGLQQYSERGSAYINEIQTLIHSNKLETLKTSS